MKMKPMLKIKKPTFHFSIERWKYNIEHDIWVSTHGRLKNNKGKLVSPKIDNGGYMVYKGAHVHRLVMETWKPVPNFCHLTVDHLNHNKRENTLWNLEWVTKEENLKRAKEDMYIPTEEDEEDTTTVTTPSIPSVDAVKQLKIMIDGKEKTIADIETMFTEPAFKNMKDATKRGYVGQITGMALFNSPTMVTIGGHTISRCKT